MVQRTLFQALTTGHPQCAWLECAGLIGNSFPNWGKSITIDRLISDNEVAKETGQEEILLCTAFQRQSVFLRIVNNRNLP